ncbi:MAG: hypothetical protein PHY73_03680 [Candidatus Omnitrophica bacterium]|nr:hypothetical protein [Candidatus Omnitrophota bacterium]
MGKKEQLVSAIMGGFAIATFISFVEFTIYKDDSVNFLVAKFLFYFASFIIVMYFSVSQQKKRMDKWKENHYSKLNQEEFRCFKCKALINQDDEKCPQCGWKW